MLQLDEIDNLVATSLLQLVDKLQQASKIDNLQQVCGVFGCVRVIKMKEKINCNYTVSRTVLQDDKIHVIKVAKKRVGLSRKHREARNRFR